MVRAGHTVSTKWRRRRLCDVKALVDPQVSVEQLYAEHAHGLCRLAVLLLDDHGAAEDVVQEAFLGLYSRQAALRDPESALSYARSAVLNGARSRLRRARVARRHLHQVVPTASAESSALLAEDHREVLAALKALPARQREAVVLRYWAGLNEAQIAAAMGVSPGSVKTHTSRAMSALNQDLRSRQ
jgi:RNA polymerase sigma-70 factor (sigma-E family)